MMKNTASNYGWMTKLLHWVITLAVFAQFFFMFMLKSLCEDNPMRGTWMMLHKSTGFTIFCLAIIFVVWRLCNQKPD